MRSMEWKPNDWEDYSWKYLSLIGDEQVISLQRTKVYVFSDSVLCLGKIQENPKSNTSPEYRDLNRIDGEPMEFEWNIFSGFNTLQLSQEVKSLLLREGETPENFTGRIKICVDVQRHLLWIKRQWKGKRVECSTRFSIWKEIRSWTMVISRSWFWESGILSVKIVHKVDGTEWQKRWC